MNEAINENQTTQWENIPVDLQRVIVTEFTPLHPKYMRVCKQWHKFYTDNAFNKPLINGKPGSLDPSVEIKPTIVSYFKYEFEVESRRTQRGSIELEQFIIDCGFEEDNGFWVCNAILNDFVIIGKYYWRWCEQHVIDITYRMLRMLRHLFNQKLEIYDKDSAKAWIKGNTNYMNRLLNG